jgi:hypothetical protein
MPMPRRPILILAAALLVIASAALWWWRSSPSGLPQPGTGEYERATRGFYTGLAALEVGLLDDALGHFTTVTQVAPAEPAGWANVAVAHLRRGDVEAAAAPVEAALRLDEDHAPTQLLAARLEIARGRLDEGVAHLRRAVALDDEDVRARFALAEELERAGEAGAGEALTLLDDILARNAGNTAVLLERTRLAAVQSDQARMEDSVATLSAAAAEWPEAARTQYAALASAVRSRDATAAVRGTLLLRNVLARVPSFTSDLAVVRTPPELVADTIDAFVVLPSPTATPAVPDRALTFAAEPLGDAAAAVVTLHSPDGVARPVPIATDGSRIWRTDGREIGTFPGSDASPPGVHGLLALDWNNDFATDLLAAGSGGIRLYVQRDGTFVDSTATAFPSPAAQSCDCVSAWSADIEMDGDLDLVLGIRGGGTRVLRNNGDGTGTPVDLFASVTDAVSFAWADLDGDGDPDAAVAASGRLRIFLNGRAGQFTEIDAPALAPTAIAAADLGADGRFEIVSTDARGGLRSASLDVSGAWREATLAADGARDEAAGALWIADLDNNGALDVVRTGTATRIWLADERHQLEPLGDALRARVTGIADLDGDGRLDLAGVSGAPVQLRNRGTAPYHWKQIQVRAQAAAGDQRINPFAVGGEIDVRAGLLRQHQLLTGLPVHVGLGAYTSIDVARIVWPNGVAQAEFALGADDAITAEQRLKGSCPWVFAYDGSSMQFVTDFIWRSPLGLRINAQDTAGVTQTEDWIRIRGDQLAPRDGKYDVRITAELWETHFFDHVSLMTVDHPAGTEVFVDERFHPVRPVPFTVLPVRELQPVSQVLDHGGGDVTMFVADRDGVHLPPHTRGHYQGIAGDHTVTFTVPERQGEDADGRPVLIAQGWVYPTDSSINVAVAQGTRERPRALSLEAETADGGWRVVDGDLGFPAGKNKTMVIDLTGAGSARRLRLRTSMEISWDRLATGLLTDAHLRTERLAASAADLRFRGYSHTMWPRGDAPETPVYAPVAATAQRWRDLVGYYTRFGDVAELIAGVDDRYVIMNAGDELALSFDAPPPPPDGWTRDFVLIGDGWEKDGDFNTAFSDTVLPLPSHGAAYGAGSLQPLEADPVYRRHAEDWQRFHTRHVRPEHFGRGLAVGSTR